MASLSHTLAYLAQWSCVVNHDELRPLDTCLFHWIYICESMLYMCWQRKQKFPYKQWCVACSVLIAFYLYNKLISNTLSDCPLRHAVMQGWLWRLCGASICDRDRHSFMSCFFEPNLMFNAFWDCSSSLSFFYYWCLWVFLDRNKNSYKYPFSSLIINTKNYLHI